MPNQAAALVEADAPRPWARAILHARIPAPLKLLLLALFAAFSMANATARTRHALRKDWLFSANTDFSEDLESAQDPYVLRRLLQLRAEQGWLLRRKPNHGMSLSGQRAPAPRPPQAARAPPQRPHVQNPPNPSLKPRAPRRRLTPHRRAGREADPPPLPKPGPQSPGKPLRLSEKTFPTRTRARPSSTRASKQKFFGSFFQKRTASFLTA